MQRPLWALSALITTAALSVAACTPAAAPEGDAGTAPEAETGGAAAVSFAKPADGETVTSPVEVCLDATGVAIEPAGDGTVRAGYGHHHVLIDPPADEIALIEAGEMAVVAKDETHVHMGDGSLCTELTLAPGEHALMAVVADGAHAPLNPPVVATIHVTSQ